MELNFNLKLNNPFKRSVSEKETPGQNVSGSQSMNFDSMSLFNGIGGEIPLDTAMKFTAVFAAMRLRAECVASLPKTLTERIESGKIEALNHPIYKLIKYRPNGYMNVFSFWEYTNSCLDGWGNAYVLIRRNSSAVPVELLPIHPKYVYVTLSNGKKWFRVSGSRWYDGLYSDDDMLHFFSLSIDGIRGINPISYNSPAIRSGIGATAFGNEFFDKGGNIKAVLENDRTMGVTDFKEFQEKFNGNSNHETALLDGGWKYKSIGMAPEAAQMIQTRTLAIQDIARIFNVPPHLLAELSRATFSNIEHQDIQFIKYSMRPTLKRYEVELENKLLFDNELGKIEMKFNIDGFLRGDMKTRAAFYHNAILDGWLNRNEVREIENRNQVEGLDEYLYPSNQNITGKEEENEKENSGKEKDNE
ncbi:phage portal protein [Parabacteroides acidifaciens]|uniref:Phage portal protein n=1 Tax=Parabacteroides acidifaciens TaxID=2290935 RepID=A0A3D8HB72_9BACT|nr:phage portal protein [Parabacteroides acidifaciens]MBC8603169.1 phage portal protein [Parabacteroides acidifaciens]RDU48101.1 phage portal protein [Parabacteroides acidifaciens]